MLPHLRFSPQKARGTELFEGIIMVTGSVIICLYGSLYCSVSFSMFSLAKVMEGSILRAIS